MSGAFGGPVGAPYRLAPHPWDEVGPPPPVGPDYEAADFEAAVAYAAAVMDADGEAERLRAEADRVFDHVRFVHAEFIDSNPSLAVAIDEDPYSFRTAAEIRRWLAEGNS